MTPIKPDNSAPKLTDRQLRFVQEYPVDFNATKAAIRAGYAPTSAANTGYDLRQHAGVQALLAERLNALALTADEAVLQLSHIASTCLNDYFDFVATQRYEQREELVTVLLAHARNEIKHILAFIGKARLGKDERGTFDEKIIQLQAKIVDWEWDVERFGDEVTRLAPGRPVVGYVAELNLVKLAQAKQLGRIKSYSVSKDGAVKVETYAADGALRDILKLHGRFIKKVELKDLTDPLAKLTDDELTAKLRGYLDRA